MLGVALLLLGVAWYFAEPVTQEQARQRPIISGPAESKSTKTQTDSTTGLNESSQKTDPPDTAAIAETLFERSDVHALIQFRAELQEFFDYAETYQREDHSERANELLRDVMTLKENGFITSPEALTLRLSLLRYSATPEDFQAAAQTLINEAKEQAMQAEKAWAERDDPQLRAYRKAEKDIVREAQSMETFPNGQTQQEYLRERLKTLRSEVYGN